MELFTCNRCSDIFEDFDWNRGDPLPRHHERISIAFGEEVREPCGGDSHITTDAEIPQPKDY